VLVHNENTLFFTETLLTSVESLSSQSLNRLKQHAPDIPWDDAVVLDLFQQMTRQLGTLATANESNEPKMRSFLQILKQLADYEIGVILSDLVQKEQMHDDEDDNSDSDDDERDERRMATERAPLGKRSRRLSTQSATPDSALEVLVDFLKALLHGVRRDHPSDVLSFVEAVVSTCLSIYQADKSSPDIPIPVLDVLLRCIGQGPTELVIESAATGTSVQPKQKRATAAVNRVRKANPTYQVAARVILGLLNKIAEPISQLLNGILNGEPQFTEQSTIRCSLEPDTPVEVVPNSAGKRKKKATNAPPPVVDTEDNDDDVYNIIYELHVVAPQILVTVVGTLASGLRSPFAPQRYQVTHIFGRLFASEHASFATAYASSFREWIKRKLDVESSIRICVVRHSMAIIKRHSLSGSCPPPANKRAKAESPAANFEFALAAADALKFLITTDMSLDVRIEGIHLVCDWAYNTLDENSSCHGIIASLLRAVGSRVSAKHKQERRDAVSGLAGVYNARFLRPFLKSVLSGGDDCDPTVVAQTLHELCQLDRATKPTSSSKKRRLTQSANLGRDGVDDQYRWIPSTILECVCFTDQIDTEMRSRVVQLVDEVLLGSTKKMTPTAQALAWTVLIDSLMNDGILGLLPSGENTTYSNSFKFMQQLFQERASLQKSLSRYIDLRVEARHCEAGKCFFSSQCCVLASHLVDSYLLRVHESHRRSPKVRKKH
jgi:hypothetical protein